jgi:hypothetical protein
MVSLPIQARSHILRGGELFQSSAELVTPNGRYGERRPTIEAVAPRLTIALLRIQSRRQVAFNVSQSGETYDEDARQSR